MSVRPVWRPATDHSVCPCLARSALPWANHLSPLPWLEKPAQAEQVLHRGLYLDLAGHPAPCDVHRLLRERENLVAVGGQPDVGRRFTGRDVAHRVIA